MQKASEAIVTLQQLAGIGVHISIDDFGTGYSSLSYLKRFPLHTLKIDRSFIRDISEDADDAAIVSAIIAMAHHLRLKVVAEGVETKDQLRHLRLLGSDEYQGYYRSRPLPAEDFERMLASPPKREPPTLPGRLGLSTTKAEGDRLKNPAFPSSFLLSLFALPSIAAQSRLLHSSPAIGHQPLARRNVRTLRTRSIPHTASIKPPCALLPSTPASSGRPSRSTPPVGPRISAVPRTAWL